jgi:hypothetical protein
MVGDAPADGALTLGGWAGLLTLASLAVAHTGEARAAEDALRVMGESLRQG